MAGTTERAFRLLCRRGGAGLVCSEMVSANALHYGSDRTENLLLRTFEIEHPVSIQIFGGDAEIMAGAVKWAEQAGADIIDINMGCTVPKVRRSGAGVELMADPDRAVAVTRAVVRRAGVPVTVKLRAGLHEGDEGYLELARRLVDAGAQALALHARTVSQGFGGKADWAHIARLVAAVPVPVIGNGDVTSPGDAARMVRETGCAAVMIARGAWGRPWVFGQAAAAIRGEPVGPDPSPAERLAVALCHAQMLVADRGERIALHQMRGQMRHYTRGLPWARQLRADATVASSLGELRGLIEAYLAGLGDGAGPAPECEWFEDRAYR